MCLSPELGVIAYCLACGCWGSISVAKSCSKIYEVFIRKRCWACAWFICVFSRNNFEIFWLVFQELAGCKPPTTAQVSRLAGAHKAPGTRRTRSNHRRSQRVSNSWNTPWQFRWSVCLVCEGHQLIALIRSWSVDVSFSFGQILFFPLFPIGVFRGGRQWLLRVVVSEESLCESQSRTNSEPVVIHLRFGSWARPEGHPWWNSNLKMTRCWRNQLAPAESADAVVPQGAKWTFELL